MEHIGTAIELLITPAALVTAAVFGLVVITGLATRISLLIEDFSAQRRYASPTTLRSCCRATT